ncbi:MAG: hypothetical protein WD063_01130 [Pirellulales bacterium]
MAEEEIGRVTHYFGKIGVAAIEVTSGSLAVGDTIHVKGHTTDFTEVVSSIEIDNHPVPQITAGQSAAIKIAEHARAHDVVYKLTP